jgi:hypothetical protein
MHAWQLAGRSDRTAYPLPNPLQMNGALESAGDHRSDTVSDRQTETGICVRLRHPISLLVVPNNGITSSSALTPKIPKRCMAHLLATGHGHVHSFTILYFIFIGHHQKIPISIRPEYARLRRGFEPPRSGVSRTCDSIRRYTRP